MSKTIQQIQEAAWSDVLNYALEHKSFPDMLEYHMDPETTLVSDITPEDTEKLIYTMYYNHSITIQQFYVMTKSVSGRFDLMKGPEVEIPT